MQIGLLNSTSTAIQASANLSEPPPCEDIWTTAGNLSPPRCQQKNPLCDASKPRYSDPTRDPKSWQQ
jgi:hypothetical protein